MCQGNFFDCLLALALAFAFVYAVHHLLLICAYVVFNFIYTIWLYLACFSSGLISFHLFTTLSSLLVLLCIISFSFSFN